MALVRLVVPGPRVPYVLSLQLKGVIGYRASALSACGEGCSALTSHMSKPEVRDEGGRVCELNPAIVL